MTWSSSFLNISNQSSQVSNPASASEMCNSLQHKYTDIPQDTTNSLLESFTSILTNTVKRNVSPIALPFILWCGFHSAGFHRDPRSC